MKCHMTYANFVHQIQTTNKGNEVKNEIIGLKRHTEFAIYEYS